MSIKLTEKQLQLLINALRNRVNELNDILNPLLTELAEHERFLAEHTNQALTSFAAGEKKQSFEFLSWSKKIIKVLYENDRFMTTNEVVAEIIKRVPELAEEFSTRSSIASILSRRSGKLFKKLDDKYGLIEWADNRG
jgi:deoxyhypusine synthase